METELTGISEVMAKLGAALSSMGDLTEEAMREVVDDIGQRAADRAPVETGALRGSMTAQVETDGDTVIGEVRFNEKYAAVQHERLDFNHPQGGEAKYLERAALEKADQVLAKIASAMGGVTGGI